MMPGMGQPGMGQPGMGAPGMGQPGMRPPGMGQPGMGNPLATGVAVRPVGASGLFGGPTPTTPAPGSGLSSAEKEARDKRMSHVESIIRDANRVKSRSGKPAAPGGLFGPGSSPGPGPAAGAPRPELMRPPGGSSLAPPSSGAVPPDAELCRRAFPPDTGPLGLVFDTTVPLTVRNVLPDSAAKCRDVRPGDVLLRVNDLSVAAMRREQVKPLLKQRPLFLDFARPRKDE